MIRVPGVAIIIENSQKEILLLLRDDDPGISYPNYWTLVGGKVEDGETPETAAHREMLEEIGVDTDVTFWKRYDRQHPFAIVDQHIYIGKIDIPRELLTLGEGQDIRFFNSNEIKNLKIGFEFDTLLHEYFLGRKAN
ncbi:MAG: NUDIX domain-containing protein [Oxalobacteraceae bacterium]